MKQGIATLQDLAVEVDRQKKAKRDFITDTRKLVFHDDARLLIGTLGTFTGNDVFHEQVSAKTGVPKRYYDLMLKSAPGLLATNVNHWFNANPEQRLVRTLDGHARAFLSDRYRPLDNPLILEAGLEGLKGRDMRVESCQLTDRKMYVKIVFPDLHKSLKIHASQVRSGRMGNDAEWTDILMPGIVLSNSEVGCAVVDVESFIYTGRCKNGTIFSTNIGKRHLGKALGGGDEFREIFTEETLKADDKAFALKVRDMVSSASSPDVFEQHFRLVEEASKRIIEGTSLSEAAEPVLKHFDVGENASQGILDLLVRGGDFTQWGLSSAVTEFAQGVESYDHSTDLERIGGRIVELSQEDWSSLVRSN